MPTTAAHHTTVSHTAADAGSTSAPAARARTVLLANAAFTAISAVVLLAAPGAVDDLLATGHPGWLRLVGLGLAVFALAVMAAASISDEAHLRTETLAIAAADGAWVLASAVVIVLGWFSAEGTAAVVGVALVVGSFAFLELRAARAIPVQPT